MGEGKFVVLKLEKNGEKQEVKMKTNSMMDMAKKAAKLARLNKNGWKVLEVTGNDTGKAAFMQKIAEGYIPGAKEMLKEAGLPGMPKKLKRFFKRKHRNADAAGPREGDPEAPGSS